MVDCIVCYSDFGNTKDRRYLTKCKCADLFLCSTCLMYVRACPFCLSVMDVNIREQELRELEKIKWNIWLFATIQTFHTIGLFMMTSTFIRTLSYLTLCNYLLFTTCIFMWMRIVELPLNKDSETLNEYQRKERYVYKRTNGIWVGFIIHLLVFTEQQAASVFYVFYLFLSFLLRKLFFNSCS